MAIVLPSLKFLRAYGVDLWFLTCDRQTDGQTDKQLYAVIRGPVKTAM